MFLNFEERENLHLTEWAILFDEIIKGKELLTTNQKYYLVDLDLKNITTSNHYETNLGRKLENVVFFELLRRGGKVYAGKNNDKEIDFVVQKANNEREYYQVAFTVTDEKTFEREISAFEINYSESR